MEPLGFLFGVIFLGTVFAIVRMMARTAMRCMGAAKGGTAGLGDAQERMRAMEVLLVDAHRQNEQLKQQLEWQTKMLEMQDTFQARGSDARAVTVAPRA